MFIVENSDCDISHKIRTRTFNFGKDDLGDRSCDFVWKESIEFFLSIIEDEVNDFIQVPGMVWDLEIGADGMLYGNVWTDNHFYNDNGERAGTFFNKNLFIWDAAQLVEMAVAAYSSRKGDIGVPFDVEYKNGKYVQIAPPQKIEGTRKDSNAGTSPDNTNYFGWILGIGKYASNTQVANLQATGMSDYFELITNPYYGKGATDNVYTSGDTLGFGISKEEVAKQIAEGTFNPFTYYLKSGIYNTWDFATLGFVGRQGDRINDLESGKIDYSQFVEAGFIDVFGTVGSLALGGQAGILAEALEGAAIGAAYDVAFQLSDIGTDRAIYELTDGRSGVYKTLEDFSVISLGINTVSGAGIGAGLHWFGSSALGTKVIFKLPTLDSVLPISIAVSTAQKIKAKFASPLADTTGAQVLRNVDGTTFSIKDSNKILTVPGQGKQDSLDAAQYAYENAHLLKNNINKELSTYEQLAQALQIHNSFILASRASILDASVIRRLNEKQPIINDVDSLIDYYKYKVDEDIVDFGIRSDKKFADYSSSRLHQEIINDLFDQDKLARKLLASTDDRAKLAEKIKVKEEFCFVAGTLVHTDKGLVPIQELKIGDKVLSKDESGEGELIYKPVVRTIKSATKQKIISPVEGVYCTDNHPFWTHAYGEDKPRWVAARRITSNDIVDCLYPLVNYYGYKNEISGLYHESVRDPYQIGGNYLVATGHPNIALCMADFASKNDGPDEIAMRVIDFSSGEPLEVLTNDKDSGFDPVSHHSKVPDTSLSRSFWPGVYKFLDKENPEQRVEIKFYGQLVDDYIMPDWDTDINATSQAYTDYVYNIEVADTHTYFIGEQAIWVHNTNCTGDVRRDIERGFRVGHSLGTVMKTGFLFE